MDLEEFRLDQGLTYQELADLIGVSQPKQARSYALGHAWPQHAAMVDQICERTGHRVTVAAMHERRLKYERERGTDDPECAEQRAAG